MQDLQIMITAGGKGTRISSLASNIPKPMIRIADKPVLEWQIEFFARLGFKDITISIGHLGNIIQKYFGTGEKFGVNIHYIVENEPLGTAGALRYLSPRTGTLILVNGDILFDFDLNRMLSYHAEKNADITLFTHPNSHPYDSAIIDADANGRITHWFNKEDERVCTPNRVNAGIHIINLDALDFNSEAWKNPKVDLDRDILKRNIQHMKIFAYDSPEYVKDMGTPERYRQVEADVNSGALSRRNLNRPQKAIFLDRDGTINRHVGFINNPAQIELLPGAAAAIKVINQSPFLAIVVSNQPVIARGECTFDEMDRINNRLAMLLGFEGAYFDDIIFCPHHPKKGFSGEVVELKIDCECRKPKPGMLLKMAAKYNVSLADSYMIGDSLRDVEAGHAAGCRSIFIGEETATLPPNCFRAKNLLEAVMFIMKETCDDNN